MSVSHIFKNWVLILAAIGPIAGLVAGQIFGHGLFGITFRPSLGMALTTAVTSYVMAIVGTFGMALIFNWLAPSFGGTSNFVSAVKLAAFSFTAAWLAGIFQLVPGFGWLAILGCYSFYLLYTGGPLLMRVPAEKAMSYTVVTVIASIVMFFIVGAVANRTSSSFTPKIANPGSISGTVGIPGVGSIDLAKMAAAGKQMEAVTKQVQAAGAGTGTGTGAVVAGKVVATAVAPDVLQALLPEALGAWARTEISSSGTNAGSVGAAQANARYRNGDQSFRLRVTDIAAMGALASMAGALNVQSSSQTETGYEKTAMIDGRMTTEKWDSARKSGKYSVLVASRFMVEAKGEASGIDALKQAVASVGIDRLEKMAK
jgi:hypothetical protein